MLVHEGAEPRQLHALRRGPAGWRLVAGLWCGLRIWADCHRRRVVKPVDVGALFPRLRGETVRVVARVDAARVHVHRHIFWWISAILTTIFGASQDAI